MSRLAIPRRTVLAGLGATVLAPALTRRAHAGGDLVAAIYPAAWEDAYVGVVKPAVKAKHDINVNFASLYAVDQIAKLAAARGNPPFDVIVLDPGPRITAIERQVIERFDAGKLTNRAAVPPIFIDDWGIGVSAQIVGLGYNPKKMDAPKSWTDILTPPYLRRLALVGFQTTFGTMSLMELNKQLGGSIENPEPVFKVIKEIAPNVGAVAAPATIATLYQQGQVDLIYHTYAEIAAMKSRGPRHRVRQAGVRHADVLQHAAPCEGRQGSGECLSVHRHRDREGRAGEAAGQAVELPLGEQGRRPVGRFPARGDQVARRAARHGHLRLGGRSTSTAPSGSSGSTRPSRRDRGRSDRPRDRASARAACGRVAARAAAARSCSRRSSSPRWCCSPASARRSTTTSRRSVPINTSALRPTRSIGASRSIPCCSASRPSPSRR